MILKDTRGWAFFLRAHYVRVHPKKIYGFVVVVDIWVVRVGAIRYFFLYSAFGYLIHAFCFSLPFILNEPVLILIFLIDFHNHGARLWSILYANGKGHILIRHLFRWSINMRISFILHLLNQILLYLLNYRIFFPQIFTYLRIFANEGIVAIFYHVLSSFRFQLLGYFRPFFTTNVYLHQNIVILLEGPITTKLIIVYFTVFWSCLNDWTNALCTSFQSWSIRNQWSKKAPSLFHSISSLNLPLYFISVCLWFMRVSVHAYLPIFPSLSGEPLFPMSHSLWTGQFHIWES